MTIEANTTNSWLPTPWTYPTTPWPHTYPTPWTYPTQPAVPYYPQPTYPTQPAAPYPRVPINSPSIEEFEALKKEVARLKELIDDYFKIED